MSATESQLADLIAEFGPPSRTSRAQSAAYPFTRLRADGVWVLDQDVQMDLVGPLASKHVSGRFEASMESALRNDPALVRAAARALVLSNFPETVAPDVLAAVGLDDAVLGSADDVGDDRRAAGPRRRDPGWRSAVLQAWDRQCAFCGYDGQVARASAGIEAALKDQELAGVDVVSDGELRRDNDIDYLLVRIPGVEIPHRAKTDYYDYYEAQVTRPLLAPHSHRTWLGC